jgi:hypothetical protein
MYHRGSAHSIITISLMVLVVMTSVNFAIYNVLTTTISRDWEEDFPSSALAGMTMRQRDQIPNLTSAGSMEKKKGLKAAATQVFSNKRLVVNATVPAKKIASNTSLDVEETLQVLRSMGIKESELNIHKQNLPPWSQILENYGGKNEAIILGLEYCEDYRKTTPFKDVALGPSGLFSTGTNLLYTLLKSNCQSPDHSRYGRQRPLKFTLMQVPWGKHNPEEARGVYEVGYMKRYVENPMTVLPVVSIRHPYTWMSAMCRHTYGTQWMHIPELCYKTLNLISPVEKVPYGAKNGTQSFRNSYKSLAHMYMEWYQPFFRQRDYKRLMIRFEDLVFRPKEVVTQVCECVGGTVTGWKGKFQYKIKSSNRGPGHGQRSDLITAFVKYGHPLSNFYAEYNKPDRIVMGEAFQEDQRDKGGIFHTFKYKLEA